METSIPPRNNSRRRGVPCQRTGSAHQSRWLFLLLLLGLNVYLGTTVAQAGYQQETTTHKAPNVAANDPAVHALLIVDDHVLHLAFRTTIDGIPVDQHADKLIDQLMNAFDRNHDHKIAMSDLMRSPLQTQSRTSPIPFRSSERDAKKMLKRDDLAYIVRQNFGPVHSISENFSAADIDLEVFDFLDLNKDGKIDQMELASASQYLASKDLDHDDCIAFEELVGDDAFEETRRRLERVRGLARLAVAQEIMFRIEPAGSNARIFSRLDRDQNKLLSAAELTWDQARLAKLDQTNDQQIDTNEFKQITVDPADIEVSCELSSKLDGPKFSVKSPRAKFDTQVKGKLQSRLSFPGLSVSIFVHPDDVVAKSLTEARNRFEQFDTTKDGYLTRAEVPEPGGMNARTTDLFRLVDTDADEEIYWKELELFTRWRAEILGSICVIKVSDEGRGYFQTIDRNGDRRISLRERRRVGESLRSMSEKSASDAISPENSGGTLRSIFRVRCISSLPSCRIDRDVRRNRRHAKRTPSQPSAPFGFNGWIATTMATSAEASS